jgi:hypothetical protein
MTFAIIENGDHVVDPFALHNFVDHLIESNYFRYKNMAQRREIFDKELRKYNAWALYSNKNTPALHGIEAIYFDNQESWIEFWMMWS